MTIRQRQHLLAYLEYYDGPIDGDWGPGSQDACRAFQEDFGGITVDGFGGTETDGALKHAVSLGFLKREEPVSDSGTSTVTFWDEIQFFTREEFRCQCGGKYCNGFPAEPKEKLVRIADQLRRNLGVPVSIISGLRCERWNAIQGGVADSQHMYGEAMDVLAKGKSQAIVERELDAIGGVRYHYPITNSNNVHFDIEKGAR